VLWSWVPLVVEAAIYALSLAYWYLSGLERQRAHVSDDRPGGGGCGQRRPTERMGSRHPSCRKRAAKWAKITTAGLERLLSLDPSDALALFDEVQPS
jgi:hypothetical protein